MDRREMAAEAEGLLKDPAFSHAVLTLRKQWFAEFLGSTTEIDAVIWRSKFQALESIPKELQLFVDNYKADLKRGK